MHHLTVHVKEGLPFAQDLLLENSEVPYLFSTDLTQFVSYFFSSIDAISSNIDELLSKLQSTLLLLNLSLMTLMPIIRTG